MSNPIGLFCQRFLEKLSRVNLHKPPNRTKNPQLRIAVMRGSSRTIVEPVCSCAIKATVVPYGVVKGTQREFTAPVWISARTQLPTKLHGNDVVDKKQIG